MSLVLATETRILQYKGQRRHARQQWIGRSTPGAEQGSLAKRTLKQIGGHESRRCLRRLYAIPGTLQGSRNGTQLGAGQPSSGTSNKSPSTVVTQIHQRTNNPVAEHWRSAKKVHPRMIPQQRVPSSYDGLPALATQRQLPSLPSRSFPPSPPSLPPPHDS